MRAVCWMGWNGVGGVAVALAACTPTATELRAPQFRAAVRAGAPPGFGVVDTPNYVLTSDVGGQRLAELGREAEAARSYYSRRFPAPSSAWLGAVSELRLYGAYADFVRAMGQAGRQGVIASWDARANLLSVTDLPEPLRARHRLGDWGPQHDVRHEVLHQYLWFRNRGVQPAPWFGEGYGELFARADFRAASDGAATVRANPARARWLPRFRKDLPDLRDLLATEAFFGRRQLEEYALAWALAWMCEEQRQCVPPGPWADLPDRYLAALDAAWERTADRSTEGGRAARAAAFRAVFADCDWPSLEGALRRAVAQIDEDSELMLRR